MEARTLLSTLLVSNLSDSGAGSLPAAITIAGNGDIIDLRTGCTAPSRSRAICRSATA